MGHGFAAPWLDRHPGPDPFVPVDRAVDFAARPVRSPPDKGEVAALEGAAVASMSGELGRQAPMSAVVLGHDHEAAGVLVEPVDDARPLLAADAGEAIAAVGDQGVDQVPLQWPAAGWTTSPLGLSMTMMSASS